jgi:hypothetical protein
MQEVTPVYIWIIIAQRERDTCNLILSKDYIDMDAKILNIGKGDEIIRKCHGLLTRSKENS